MDNTKVLDIIKNNWLEEKSRSPKLTFAMFIYRWQDKITSLTMLRELHRYAGLKNFASWKQVYFKNYPNFILVYNDKEVARNAE